MGARMSFWALLMLVVAVGATVAWSVWTKWPSVLRYRIHRIDRHTTTLVQRYLDGRQSLESAARRLAALYAEKTALSGRLPIDVAPGGASLQAIVIAVPSGLSLDDQRVKVLSGRMWEYMPQLDALVGYAPKP